MTHEQAYALVSEICPERAGLRWNTTSYYGCDTAWAVAYQYEDGEVERARQALQKLAAGEIPDEWESTLASHSLVVLRDAINCLRHDKKPWLGEAFYNKAIDLYFGVSARMAAVWPKFGLWMLADNKHGVLQEINEDLRPAVQRIIDIYCRWNEGKVIDDDLIDRRAEVRRIRTRYRLDRPGENACFVAEGLIDVVRMVDYVPDAIKDTVEDIVLFFMGDHQARKNAARKTLLALMQEAASE